MTAQDAAPSSRPVSWDRDRLTTALAVAARQARSEARRRRLSRADRDDLQQDILMALLERSARFDPVRGSWGAFVTVLARRAVIDRARRPAPPKLLSLNTPEGQRLAEILPSVGDQRHAVEFGIVLDALPDEPRALLGGIIRHADLAEARESSSASPATFYRQLSELRCWLRVVGAAPPSGAGERAAGAREKQCVPVRR